jgi:hypothetical protein
MKHFYFFDANTFQIQPFHKGLAMMADVAFCFMPGALEHLHSSLHWHPVKIKKVVDKLPQDVIFHFILWKERMKCFNSEDLDIPKTVFPLG